MIPPVALGSRGTLGETSVSVNFCYITKQFKTRWPTTTTKRKKEKKKDITLAYNLRSCSVGLLCLSGSCSLGPDSVNTSWALTHLWSAVELTGNWLVYDGSSGMAYLWSCRISSRKQACAWSLGGSSSGCKTSKKNSPNIQALFRLLPWPNQDTWLCQKSVQGDIIKGLDTGGGKKFRNYYNQSTPVSKGHWVETRAQNKCVLDVQFSSVQSLSCVWLFATPWIAAR